MTQQETLKEFMNRRMAELGLGYKALTNAGIGGQTMHNINHCIPFRMTEGTKSKLATVLQCSIGDINAALAVTAQTTPFGEEVTKVPVKKQEIPSVMKTVDKLEQMVEEDYPELFTEESGTNEEKSEPIPDKTDIKPDKTEPASPKSGIKADKAKVRHGGRVPAETEGYVPAAAVRGRSVRRGFNSIVCSYWPKTA